MKPVLPKTFVAGVVASGVLAVAAWAGGPPPRAVSVTLGAPVRHLAADARGVAVHARPGSACDTILLWLPPAKPAKLSVQNCQQPSTGADVTSLALHGRRPAWVGYAGGNYREFTVSTTLQGRSTFVSLRPVPVDDAAAVHWRVAPGGAPLAFEQDGSVWRLVATGGRACPYPYGAKVCVQVPAKGTLLGVGGGRLLLRAAGAVSLVRQDGSVVRAYPDAPEAATDGTVVVELATGKLTSGTRSFAVPKNSHLVGIRRGLAAVTSGRTTIVVRLRDGRRHSLAGSVAAISDVGLYTATGTRLTFTPAAALGL
jgi:hypothetical protein